MAKIRPPFTITALIIFLLLAATAPAPTHSVTLSQFHTLLSLTNSLLTRVSNLRAERGDISGANRAKFISQKLQQGLGFGSWGFSLSFGWDYAKNDAWRDLNYRELYGAVSDLNELMSSLSELLRVDSDTDTVARVSRSYRKILVVSKRLFVRLRHVFPQSGPLREVVEILKIEMVDGDLLRDCLEIGSNDFKGLTQIVKDIVLQYYPTVHDDDDENDL